MYFPYGFPQCLDAGDISPAEALVHTTFTDDHLLVVYTSRIQAWSAGQHRIRVGEVVVSPADLKDEGHHIAAVWCQSRRRLALVTSKGYLHIYAISTSREVLWQPPTGPPAKQTNIYIQNSVHVESQGEEPVAVLADAKSILIVYPSGYLHATDWNGRPGQEVAGEAPSEQPVQPLEGIVCSADYSPSAGLLALVVEDGRVLLARTPEVSLQPPEQIVVLGVAHTPGVAATCAAFDPVNSTLAVGCQDGQVALYALTGLAAPGFPAPALRTLCQGEWGLDAAVLGAVGALRWTPDGRALAVGQRRAGLSVWTAAGCRMLCTLRQHAAPAEPAVLEGAVSSMAWSRCGYRLAAGEARTPHLLHELHFAHSVAGDHRVVLRRRWEGAAGEEAPLPAWLRQPGQHESHFMLGADRVLLVRPSPGAAGEGREGEQSPELRLEHLRPPQQYVDATFPMVHAALDPCNGDIAVAGSMGCAVFSQALRRWRLFGDAAQERALRALALLWLPGGVVGVVAATTPSAPRPRLLLYPCSHLDSASILASLELDAPPSAADALGSYVLLASGALDVRLVRYTGPGPAAGAKATLSVLRHLSLMGAGRPLRELALVEPTDAEEGDREGDAPPAQIPAPSAQPPPSTPSPPRGVDGLPVLSVRTRRERGAGAGAGPCSPSPPPTEVLLLRCDGALSVLDLDGGAERLLASDVERFWLPVTAEGEEGGGEAGPAPPSRAGSEWDLAGLASRRGAAAAPGTLPGTELPWWVYGAQGMHLHFPSARAEGATPGPGWVTTPGSGRVALAPGAPTSPEPELAFDAGVYPLGISLEDVSVVGVTQRSVHSGPSAAGAAPPPPCLHPLPGSQPALPCLLRRLLAARRPREAAALARWYAAVPHFPRSAEWLLFTALEADERERAALGAAGSATPLSSPGTEAGWAGPGRRAEAAARRAGPTLRATVDLLAAFPALYAPTVVAVARKTDAELWPALFAAVGSPYRLAQRLLAEGEPEHAAACLLVINHLEGPGTAQNLAVQVVREALAGRRYLLAAEAVRFLTPPGEENLLQAVGLVGRAGAAGVSAARRSVSAPSAGAGEGLGAWLWSWWGGDEAGPGSPVPGPPPAPSAAGAKGENVAMLARRSTSASEGIDCLTPLVDVWSLLAGHAWALAEAHAFARLARLAAALHALPGTELEALLAAGAREAPPAAAAAVTTFTAAATLGALGAAARDVHAMGPTAVGEVAGALWAAGATNAAAALGLLRGDASMLEELRRVHPTQWRLLVDKASEDPGLLAILEQCMAGTATPAAAAESGKASAAAEAGEIEGAAAPPAP